MTRLLVLHGTTPNARATQLAHIGAFGAIPGADVVYHHLNAPVTSDLRRYPFDAVVINYDFFSIRQLNWHQIYQSRYAFVADMTCPRIALTMDDCFRSEILEDWLLFLGVDVVFSPLASHAEKIYPRLSRKGIVRNALTGYVDVELLPTLSAMAQPHASRLIDVGTRVSNSPPSHGKFALNKARYAQNFANAARSRGIICDISTTWFDAFTNLDWFRFLAGCRCTIATKGGYGLIDPRGEIRQRTEIFLQAYPEADYESVKVGCFPDVDDTFEFSAVSPRFFEAAMTRTCQIMPRGDYPGGLEAWKHYIPIEVDLRDLEHAIEAIRSRDLCEEIADRCYDALVGSGSFTHQALLDDVMSFVPHQRTLSCGAQLDEYLNTIQVIEKSREQWHPLTRMTIGVIDLFASLNQVRTIFDLIINLCVESNAFVLPSQYVSPAFAAAGKCSSTLGYTALVNLLHGLGEARAFSDTQHLTSLDDTTPTAFLPSSFCGRNPPLKNSFVSEEQRVQARLDHGTHHHAELHYISAVLPTQYFIIHARVAALRIARGNVDGAIALMQEALASRCAANGPLAPAEQAAHDGIVAALLAYAVTLGLQEPLAKVRTALANVANAGLRDRLEGELPYSTISFQSASVSLHPLTKATLTATHALASSLDARRALKVLCDACAETGNFFMPSDLWTDRFKDVRGQASALGYLAMVNLICSLGEVSEFRKSLTDVVVRRMPTTGFRYEDLETNFLDNMQPSNVYSTRARVAALRIARGDLDSALALMRQALDAPCNVAASSFFLAERSAHKGIIATLLVYAVCLGVRCDVERIHGALKHVDNPVLRARMECELSILGLCN